MLGAHVGNQKISLGATVLMLALILNQKYFKLKKVKKPLYVLVNKLRTLLTVMDLMQVCRICKYYQCIKSKSSSMPKSNENAI